MPKRGKRYRKSLEKFDRQTLYGIQEGIELVKETANANFDETIEAHIKLGIDPRRSDQNVRGTVILPHGTGKTPRVIVFTKGDKIQQALDAGADAAGAEELIKKVKEGWMDWDVASASPDVMGLVGKSLGRILGPRMPSPKAGTLNMDVKSMVEEIKSGKIQYRNDKQGIIHVPIGKQSFESKSLKQNLKVLLNALLRARPAAAKGAFFRSITLASTQGPGIKLDPYQAMTMAKERELV